VTIGAERSLTCRHDILDATPWWTDQTRAAWGLQRLPWQPPHSLMSGAAAGSLVKKCGRSIMTHALMRDPAGFVLDAETAQAADDFLSVSDALAQLDEMGAPSDERRRRAG
jgi:hypothetical protein